MSETPALYITEPDKTEITNEAQALAYCLQRADTTDQADALQRLNPCAFRLVAWVGAVKREADKGTALDWKAALAILDRPGCGKDKAALDAAGFDPAAQTDPEKNEAAFHNVIANRDYVTTTKRLEKAADKIRAAQDQLRNGETGLVEGYANEAADLLARFNAAPDDDKPLADIWQDYLKNRAGTAGPLDVLRLDERRGDLAAWMNSNLGTRAGLEPGETFILGGAPAAGKTSLAALFAVDALALGVPVLFWQLELSREETLEHMQAQRPDVKGWPAGKFWDRGQAPLPASWNTLLKVPRWPDPDAEKISVAMSTLSRRKTDHKCKGLVIVDYAQLLTMPDKYTNRFEVLEKAASRLAKTAAETGACLLLLSQMNKQDQRENAAEGTALAGADLARMAHRVALLQRCDAEGNTAGPDKNTPLQVAFDKDKGETRRLTFTKRRGYKTDTAGHRPNNDLVLWNGGGGRGFNSGDALETNKTKGPLVTL